MPISTNAPFNEFGQSMILRDIEQLYLALNGAGTGGPGDGQTQDQSEATSQESGGVPDLSGLATIDYVNEAIAAIPDVSYPISISNGGTGKTVAVDALQALGAIGSRSVLVTSGSGTFTAPSGVNVVLSIALSGGGGAYTTNTPLYAASSSGGATTTAISAIGGFGGGGGAIISLIDYTTSGPLSYVVGAAGANDSSAPTAGGASTLSGTSVTIRAGGGVQGAGGSTGAGGCNQRATTSNGASWSGAGVLWAYALPGETRGISLFGASSGNGDRVAPGVVIDGSSRYGEGGTSSTSPTGGAILFIY